jgi:N-acetylglucosaminyldiphosphoundecaprenol N-acetyl-beta-D-mannosaminyltransferase
MNNSATEDAVETRTPLAILGVPFDHVTTAGALERIEAMIISRRPHYLATANIDFVVQAQGDVELRRILFDAHMVLCDGTPLLWASRLLGDPLPERVAGSDLVPQLIQLADRKGYRIFLLGAAPEAARKAVERLRRQYPSLQLAGSYSPRFAPLLDMDHEEIAKQIREARPDILLVSFGCPKQEKWISMHYRSLGVPVAIGVGATIDFLAGHMKRAPVWMQRSGTEWIFRLMQEPRRLFKRYAMDIGVFSWRFLGQWMGSVFNARAGTPSVKTSVPTLRNNGWQHVTLPARFDQSAVRRSGTILQEVLSDHRICVVGMENVSVLDSAGLGWLMRLQSVMREQGRSLILLAPQKRVRGRLEFQRVREFFQIANSLPAALSLHTARRQELSRPVLGREPVSWQGEITAANVTDVRAATLHQLNLTRETGEITVDLSRVRFMDSSGVALMRELVSASAMLGGRIRFVAAGKAVRNVIGCCRLEKLLSVPQRSPSTPPTLVPSQQT